MFNRQLSALSNHLKVRLSDVCKISKFHYIYRYLNEHYVVVDHTDLNLIIWDITNDDYYQTSKDKDISYIRGALIASYDAIERVEGDFYIYRIEHTNFI